MDVPPPIDRKRFKEVMGTGNVAPIDLRNLSFAIFCYKHI